MPEMPALPRPFVPGDEFNPRDLYSADQLRAYGDAREAAAVAAEREACAALRLDAEQWRALDSHARYWLTIREKLIDALSREGLTIVSAAQDVHLMRLGKAEAAIRERK